MEFRDFAAAAQHYAGRYAEYAAGRLAAEQLQREREAIVVVDASGVRWGMDAHGRWVAQPTRRAGPPAWLLVLAGVVAIVLFAGTGLVATRRGPAAPTASAPATAPAPTAGPSSPAAGAPPVGGVVGTLRAGGHVIYLRHAARTNDETVVTDPADCSQQANLTPEGQQQATAVGEAFRSLGIPVGPVYASPYCRTTQTAQLAFGTVTPVAELAGGTIDPPVDPAAQRAVLEGLLSTPVAAANVVIVGHSEVIEAVTGEVVEGFAESVVFQPQGGSYRVVDHIVFEELLGLVQSCPPECG